MANIVKGSNNFLIFINLLIPFFVIDLVNILILFVFFNGQAYYLAVSQMNLVSMFFCLVNSVVFYLNIRNMKMDQNTFEFNFMFTPTIHYLLFAVLSLQITVFSNISIYLSAVAIAGLEIGILSGIVRFIYYLSKIEGQPTKISTNQYLKKFIMNELYANNSLSSISIENFFRMLSNDSVSELMFDDIKPLIIDLINGSNDFYYDRTNDIIVRKGRETKISKKVEHPIISTKVPVKTTEEAVDNITCFNCSSVIPNEGVFCPYCGVKINNSK